MAAPAVLGNHVGHKRVGATSHLHRPAIDAALDDILGTDQPSQSQSRRKRFRETANAHRLVATRQGIEAGRHCTLKREVAIDIILHNQETIVARQPDHLETPRFGQRAARRVVKVRHGIEHAGKGAACVQSY